jgi:hypothetical protein
MPVDLQNHKTVRDRRFGIVKVQEERRIVPLEMFTITPEDFKAKNTDPTTGQPFPEHQGWSNGATWEFNTYFLQEPHLIEKLLGLRRKDGGINYDKARNLFHAAQCRNWMEQMGEDEGGPVNVVEIVDDFVEAHKRKPE